MPPHPDEALKGGRRWETSIPIIRVEADDVHRTEIVARFTRLGTHVLSAGLPWLAQAERARGLSSTRPTWRARTSFATSRSIWSWDEELALALSLIDSSTGRGPCCAH